LAMSMIARGPSTLRLPKVTPMGVDESFIAATEVGDGSKCEC
jgi:hypothetical protein